MDYTYENRCNRHILKHPRTNEVVTKIIAD